MKRIVLSLFIIILIIFLNNCQRDRSKIPVFPDTGDEDTRFNVDTLTFTMDGVSKDFSKYTMGAYFSSVSSTVLAGSTAPEDADELSVWFDGSSKGTFNYMSSCLKYKHNNEERVSFNNCSVIVTSYGEIGEQVNGTFSGIVINIDTSTTNNITGGVFSITRIDESEVR